MKKYIQNALYALICCCTLSVSCKKELAYQEEQFGYLFIENKTLHNPLQLKRNNEALNFGASSTAKIPAGTAKLSFVDPTGAVLMDTMYTTELNKTTNWIVFQPTAGIKPVVIKKMASNESQPDAEHIKVKLANFATEAFPKPIDVIFYWLDENTWELVEGGRIDNIGTNFSADFTEVLYKAPTTPAIAVNIVDHQTQEPLLEGIYLSLYPEANKRILTLYLVTSNDGGSTVIGTPYKVLARTLFED